MLPELLTKLGLSGGQGNVYTVLLRDGPLPLATIHEKTGTERRNIYDILAKLIEKGLVSYVREGRRKLYSATHPAKIVAYIDEQSAELHDVRNLAENAMPELVSLFNSARSDPDAQMYRGNDGMKAVWRDVLEEKESFWIGSGNYVPERYPTFYTWWNKQRVLKKAKRHNLYRNEMRGKTIPAKLEKKRFLPAAFSAQPVVLCIYGNKVANLLLDAEFFAFVIESKAIAENHKEYFRYLWNEIAEE